MNGKNNIRTARFVQTLVYYDQPQLILLKSDRGNDVVGIAIPRSEMEYPFLSCEVRESTFSRYLAGTADLRFLLDDAIRQKYYFIDLVDADTDILPMIPAADDEARRPEYWPQPGAFSRAHTTPYGAPKRGAATKVFKIDGSWSASDFAHFHGKIANLYAMLIVLKNMDSLVDRR
jgi:hypothetical protein